MPTDSAPTLVVREIETGVRPVHLRMPFRFGAVTLQACPQLFVRVTVELEGRAVSIGHAAELMVPKWFDKRPEFTLADNVSHLAGSVELASQAYLYDSPATCFELFGRHHGGVQAQGQRRGLTELSCSFGQAVLDRAVIDAVCKALDLSFFDAARRNVFGIEAHAAIADMRDFDFTPWLASLPPPLASLFARHTVGLLDDLQGADESGDESPDELPRSLAAVIARHGHRFFKIKLAGDPAKDAGRVADVLDVLDRLVPDHRYTLDGNEQYDGASSLAEFFRRLTALPCFKRRPDALLYVEQPVSRDFSLDRALATTDTPAPLLMDEADGTLDAFVRGREHGWRGVSSKGCKGIYKAIVNRARCARWNDDARRDGLPPAFFMSAEDLTCQAGLAVQQDLAMASLLGLAHCERNGHHYVDGFGDAPPKEQRSFALLHNDLYDASSGHPRLAISKGRIAIDSLFKTGFAHRVDPDWRQMQPLCRAGAMV
jgi:hypothetical protein